MGTGADLCVIGHPRRVSRIAEALSAAGLLSRGLTPREAHDAPGSVLGAEIIVWAFSPGTHPTLEAEGYAGGAIGLYAHWDDESAEVGPVCVPGRGPCAACLRRTTPPRRGGLNPLLGSWTAAWAALHCDALLRTGSTELVGASWAWRLTRPGLTLRGWPRLPGCIVPDCGQP
ncbi:hypothetical protein G7085_18970 [Tessaracoccus sp. HDW20]|uniref:hypothetical protein n=1 Tax=Tessaracoccus coleopterorum TaxID=2714950 RepID=UPI0018D3AE69|nr:hypothetical protein [Tessaracoccus coleopterorum]NHB85919.1 hypothetical protein [Tessaracoccus coleopterorum]